MLIINSLSFSNFSKSISTFSAISDVPAFPGKQNILLMICNQCALRRGMATGDFSECGSGEVKAKNTVNGVIAGCFPQLYSALAGNMPDQVITL